MNRGVGNREEEEVGSPGTVAEMEAIARPKAMREKLESPIVAFIFHFLVFFFFFFSSILAAFLNLIFFFGFVHEMLAPRGQEALLLGSFGCPISEHFFWRQLLL